MNDDAMLMPNIEVDTKCESDNGFKIRLDFSHTPYIFPDDGSDGFLVRLDFSDKTHDRKIENLQDHDNLSIIEEESEDEQVSKLIDQKNYKKLYFENRFCFTE